MSASVEFFFDIGSPYSYLAATQIDATCLRADASVIWRPFLLGGVFKGSGNNTPGTVAAKASYMLQDLDRWAKHYGIPFSFSTHFPLNTLRTERVLVAVEAAHGQAVLRKVALDLFSRYWVDNENVATDDVLARSLASSGLDPIAVLAAADSAEVKDTLRKTTEEAIARGAFGAPTMYVGDAMFFGNDRLVLLEEHLRKSSER